MRKNGYTLIEFAVILIIMGVLAVPAAALYANYTKSQRLEQTDRSVTRAKSALGGFRSLYGRYPCPASTTAVRGDPDYGYEDCSGVAPAIITANSNNPALAATPEILIGALPFRALNMDERDAHDGRGNRLSYAVTSILTNEASFTMASGGISVIDENNNSIIAPEHTAHFIVISHGENGLGAHTRAGVISGICPAATLEGENCNNTETFRSAQKQVGFDDNVTYATSLEVSEWQLATANLTNIHLRRLDSLALGVEPGDSLAGAATAEIQESGVGAGDAVVIARDGSVQAAQLCDESETLCFPSHLIGGDVAIGLGMTCPAGEYLVGVQNGLPVCEDEVFFSCPPGQFMAGIDGSGRLICNVLPPDPCPDANITTSCGDIRSIEGTFSGGYRTTFSGKCHMIDPFDMSGMPAEFFDPSIDETNKWARYTMAGAYIATLNAKPRTTMDCGPDASTGLVRDTFQCSAGSWNPTPVIRLQRRADQPFPPFSDVPSVPANRIANVSGAAYNPAAPMSVDPNNTLNNHNCWCREDYTREWWSCGSGSDKIRFTIWKNKCPRTAGSWREAVYTDTLSCSCVPGAEIDYPSCAGHFGVSSDRMVGAIKRTRNYICVGGSRVQDGPAVIDTSDCKCPAKSPNPVITTSTCPLGKTNSFMYEGNTYTNVERIFKNYWSCPLGTPPTPASSATHAGNWTGAALAHVEACTCDSSLTKFEYKPCPDGLTGPPRKYLVRWDCDLDDWEPESKWTLLENSCTTCHWQKPIGTPISSEYKPGKPVGQACTCGTPNGICHEPEGAGSKYWSSCYCAPNG